MKFFFSFGFSRIRQNEHKTNERPHCIWNTLHVTTFKFKLLQSETKTMVCMPNVRLIRSNPCKIYRIQSKIYFDFLFRAVYVLLIRMFLSVCSSTVYVCVWVFSLYREFSFRCSSLVNRTLIQFYMSLHRFSSHPHFVGMPMNRFIFSANVTTYRFDLSMCQSFKCALCTMHFKHHSILVAIGNDSEYSNNYN